MYEEVRKLDPGGVSSREFTYQNIPHRAYQVAGVYSVMSADGYHLLTMFGFEVYAGIDAYLRYTVPHQKSS